MRLFNVNVTFLDYGGLIQSIPRIWRNCLNNDIDVDQPPAINSVMTREKAGKYMYSMIIGSLEARTVHEIKWDNNLNIIISRSEWREIYCVGHSCTEDCCLRSFHLKGVHRLLVTNKTLFTWGIKNSPICTFCHAEEESICHLFYACNITANLWRSLAYWLNPTLQINEYFNIKNMCCGVIGNVENKCLLNIIILLFKRYIYVTRCNSGNISLMSLLHFIKYYYTIEINALSMIRREAILKKWGAVGNMLARI